MRSFQQVIAFFLALVAFAFAQASDTEVYDATVYVTSTIYRVNTVTMSGTPSASVANRTSTISATHAPTTYAPSYAPSYVAASSVKLNGTSVVYPTGTGVKPSQPVFTGAASALNVNAYVAALVAAVGYLAL